MSKVLLSVICTTYGHEKYIKEALDSILMQKIDFTMEVLIGEDCSPDNSRQILKDYEQNYPGFFTVLYRDKNLGGAKNTRNLELLAQGKYIAYLELDDYWTDCNKLQQQVDILESNREVFAVAHRTKMIDAVGNPLKEKYPECKSRYYTWSQYVRGLFPGQSATLVYRNINSNCNVWSKIKNDTSFGPGDRKNAFLFLSYGKVYCIPKIMSAYRLGTEHGYSVSVSKIDPIILSQRTTKLYENLLRYAREYFGKKAVISSEKMYVLARTKELKAKGENWKRYLFFGLDVKYKNRVRLYYVYIVIRNIKNKLL